MPRRTLASTPLLVVSDLRRAADFYIQVLGYEEPAFFREPHPDGHRICLGQDVERRPEDLGR